VKRGRKLLRMNPRCSAIASLALLLLMAPSPADPSPAGHTEQPSCITAGGTTVCGYGCAEAGGTASCAQHPGGSCKTAYGKVACGFDCLAAHGDVRCAQTPTGVCNARGSGVSCFDPTSSTGAPILPPFGTPTTDLRKARCHEVGTQLVCGFNCTATPGSMVCSRTPNGACGVTGARGVCNDPPGNIGVDPKQPKMSCLESGNAIACGYGCAREGTQVMCAQTPAGSCQAVRGRLNCFDPPVAP
jgi:hypothetical protein